ncbi:ATPase, partial [Candidatus Woesearchaeota archaeon CG11_big_fil_rev_8_21_14_0_20_43_8]
MILGKLVGKNTPSNFCFKVDGNPRKFDFVQLYHKDHEKVLAQVINLTRDEEKTLARCNVLGYKDEDGIIKPVRTPFVPNTAVFMADDDYVRKIIQIEEKDGAFLGRLDGKMIDVFLDLRKLLTKHIAILAKSGAGKSYTVGVLLEEIMERRVPLLIIDPHGEYTQMKYPTDEAQEKLDKFGVKPKSFVRTIHEYSHGTDAKQITLSNKITSTELVHMLPTKLSNGQLTVLYAALQQLDNINFEHLIMELQASESSAKWNIISIIDHLRKMELFGENHTPLNELIQPGRASVINLRGVNPDMQEVIVYKLMKDLFEARKKDLVPPFFAVIEEAHNFCPERGFGEAKSSKILRNIASEGRKFGLGLCIVSQRPARVDKSVLSQITTQIILKVTNPNDLKALSNSIEGLTLEAEEEIKNLPIGTALVTGVVDMPLFVNVRPRKTKHGGHAIDILEEIDKDKFFDGIKEFEKKDL